MACNRQLGVFVVAGWESFAGYRLAGCHHYLVAVVCHQDQMVPQYIVVLL